MGFIFSVVTLTAGAKKTRFIMGRSPKWVEDLAKQHMFNRFLEDLAPGKKVKVRADVYQYGAVFFAPAAHSELDFVKMWMYQDKYFLKERCRKVDTVKYHFKVLLIRIYQQEMKKRGVNLALRGEIMFE